MPVEVERRGTGLNRLGARVCSKCLLMAESTKDEAIEYTCKLILGVTTITVIVALSHQVDAFGINTISVAVRSSFLP